MKRTGSRETWKERRAVSGRILTCGLIACILPHAVRAGAVASEDVSFPHANLEVALRDALRISEEGITVDDMATLSALDADDRGISDLSGLEHAVNLRELDLEDNEISDLGPLANLTSLQ